jgi:benzoyl-CoA-dihydrodiol lyase
MLRRTLARLDVTSRTLIALIEPGSCFAGTLLELALAADRSYMLARPDDEAAAPRIALSAQNFGAYPMANGAARVAARFYNEAEPLRRAHSVIGVALTAGEAIELGLVTVAPDELDWADEVRVVLEERAESLTRRAHRDGGEPAIRRCPKRWRHGSSDACRLGRTGSSCGRTPSRRGRALKVFGTGNKARFDRNRV